MGAVEHQGVLYQTGEPLGRKLYGKVNRIGLNETNLTFNDRTGNDLVVVVER